MRTPGIERETHGTGGRMWNITLGITHSSIDQHPGNDSIEWTTPDNGLRMILDTGQCSIVYFDIRQF